MNRIKTAAIIGAGMAGLTAARVAHEAGIVVTLYDKGRKPGGRLATRHADGFIFNHGCQFATARDPDFRATLTDLKAAPWEAAGAHKLAGTPNMASLAQNMAAPFGDALKTGQHVSFIARTPGGWHLSLRDAAATPPGLVEPGGVTAGPYDAVILAIPAVQAAGLLANPAQEFAQTLGAVSIAPCWAVMLGFAHAPAGPDTLKPETGPINWIARENSRPGAAAEPVGYTLHASPAWSREQLEAKPESVIATLSSAFSAVTGITAQPVYARAHRWRYALAETPLGQPYLWNPDLQLGVCGDWCLAGKLEAAYLSGRALGIRMRS